MPRALPRDAHLARAGTPSHRGRGLGWHALRYSLSHGVAMDSLPRDLCDALAQDVDPEVDRASAADKTSARTTECWLCKSLPGAPGSKLRYCGRCKAATYCGRLCARADWERHKHTCERFRQSHEKALAEFVAQGGRANDFNQRGDDFRSWFHKMPGLANDIELMAWSYWSQAPIIFTSVSDTDVDGTLVLHRFRLSHAASGMKI